MDYEVDIIIDDTALDIEWLEQASLAMRYGKYFAQKKQELLQSQERIKVVRAELIAKANADPEGTCDKAKPNTADIEAYYRNHKRHKIAKEEWIKAQFELDIAEIAKNEIGFTRKMALENLVKLHGQQYFAGPKVPRDLNSEVDKKRQKVKRQEKVNRGIGKSINRTN